MLGSVYGSAWVSIVAGSMLHETLYFWDSKLQPRPQMVERWSVSPDGTAWPGSQVNSTQSGCGNRL